MIGLFARHQQRAIIDYAVNVYDTAFISTNYVSLAQIAFQHYIDEHARTTEPDQASKANELLETVLDDIDVATERSSSQLTRAEGLELRANIAELLKLGANAPDVQSRIGHIEQRLERLHQNNSAIGLRARDDIEAFSYRSDLLLLASTLTSIMLAGLVLLVTHRMIRSLNQRSSDHLYAALEGMPQGLSMFDDKQRLIICNEKYAAMYFPRFSAEALAGALAQVAASPENSRRMAIAGLERSEILERVWSAKEEKRRRGELAQSEIVLPFGVGYEKGRWFYKPEAQKVRDAFREMLAGHHNYVQLATMVGVTPRGMHLILRNPIWMGWRVIDKKRDSSAAARRTGKDGRQGDRRKILRAPDESRRLRIAQIQIGCRLHHLLRSHQPRVERNHRDPARLQLGRHIRRHLVRRRLRHAVSRIADVLLCRPKRDVHDQPASLPDHRRRGKLARLVMRANARAEHRVPTPERLFPEWLAPGESPILDHALVAAPHVVHQDVDRARLAGDPVERRFHLRVHPMVAADTRDPLIVRG